MMNRNNVLITLLVCFSLVIPAVGMSTSVLADQQENGKQRSSANRIYGKVTETFNVPGYTYAEVNTGSRKVWAAGPVTPLHTGDMIAFSTEMPMNNYHSKTLKRDFSVIYFVGRFITDEETPGNKAAKNASPHSRIKLMQAAKPVKGIKKLKGGNTIAEIHANKQKLKGKTIRVRGQVTRFSAGIMGKNWLHIRDSSTVDDLTATTSSTVAVGDMVIVKGRLELDRDYGYGYVYPVIVDDSHISKE